MSLILVSIYVLQRQLPLRQIAAFFLPPPGVGDLQIPWHKCPHPSPAGNINVFCIDQHKQSYWTTKYASLLELNELTTFRR